MVMTPDTTPVANRVSTANCKLRLRPNTSISTARITRRGMRWCRTGHEQHGDHHAGTAPEHVGSSAPGVGHQHPPAKQRRRHVSDVEARLRIVPRHIVLQNVRASLIAMHLERGVESKTLRLSSACEAVARPG